MYGVSGSIGPALVLRAIFAELARSTETRPLPLSRTLRRVAICRASGSAAGPGCPTVEEWFRESDLPLRPCARHGSERVNSGRPVTAHATARLLHPTPGLYLALDPRIPDELEAFPFEIDCGAVPVEVEWLVDGALAGTTGAGERRFVWPLARGQHVVHARVKLAGGDSAVATQPVAFTVK